MVTLLGQDRLGNSRNLVNLPEPTTDQLLSIKQRHLSFQIFTEEGSKQEKIEQLLDFQGHDLKDFFSNILVQI